MWEGIFFLSDKSSIFQCHCCFNCNCWWNLFIGKPLLPECLVCCNMLASRRAESSSFLATTCLKKRRSAKKSRKTDSECNERSKDIEVVVKTTSTILSKSKNAMFTFTIFILCFMRNFASRCDRTSQELAYATVFSPFASQAWVIVILLRGFSTILEEMTPFETLLQYTCVVLQSCVFCKVVRLLRNKLFPGQARMFLI